MKDEPEIVKKLREEEKLGKLKIPKKGSYYFHESEEKGEEEEDVTGGAAQIFEEALKKESNIEIKDIKKGYRKIFENYFVGITIADEKERIIAWNKYAENMLKMGEKDLFLRNVSLLYPKKEWSRIREENIRQKGMRYKMETKMIRKDEKVFDVEISLCVLKGAHGKNIGSIGLFRDISKMKETEKKLVESEVKYKTIFDNTAVAITVTDENECIISWNKQAGKMLGFSEAELHLKPVESLYPAEEWKKIRSENIRQKGLQHHLETKIFRKNKDPLDVDISITVLKNHEGKAVGSIGVITDISVYKKNENELAFYNDLLKSLMDNIPDCIYFKDEDSNFIQVNKAKAQRFDTSPEKMIGKTEFEYFPEDQAKKSLEEDKQVIETGKPIINKIEKFKDKKGVEHWVSVSKAPRYDKKGNIIGTMGINREITEVKKSEEKYKTLFEKAIDPIVIVDKNGVFIDVNEQVLKLLGYNKKDLVGKKFNEANILTKESLGRAVECFMRRMKGESVPTYEVEVITGTGKLIPAEINASAIYENGQISGDLVILRDLRERYKRKKIEQELDESEKRFRDIFDSTGDFLLYLEKDIILDINEAGMELTNLEKQEVIGKKLSELKNVFSKDDMSRHLNAIKQAMNNSNVEDYKCEFEKNNVKYHYLFSCDCIHEDEKVKGILLRGRDITQRQRAWDELFKLEERYRVLAETSADGVITIDPLGRLTYVNPSFEKMIKRRKSQILATLFRDYLSEESVYFFQQISIDARKKDEKIENVDLEIIDSNGKNIAIEVNMAPYWKSSDFAGMVCTIRDITERRKIEDELKKSERLKTEFMNIAAHELKSPVTPIKGYLDLIISDKDASKQVKDWAKVSLRNSERLLRLVNDILDVSRLDTDTMRFDMEKLNPVEILDEIAEDMKPAVEYKNLKFNTSISRDLPHIMGDRHRLSQVLKNLLVNAVKFTDNGQIGIKAEKKKEYILISVKDTGIGVSSDELKKIFNKFYQAYTGDDRKNEGTGLGLFICKEIIQKHGGQIWVESQLGEGSQFYIKLPYLHKMVVDLKK